MEPDRKLAITTFQALIALLRVEENRLQTVIAYSQLTEHRMQAQSGLERVLEKIKVSLSELAKLEAEE